jgi:hypothetical protein
MGLFKQMKDARTAIVAAPELIEQSMQMAGQAQALAAAQQHAAVPQPVAGAGADLEPIAGVSLAQFAAVCKGLAAHGYDQSKGAEVAAQHGIPADRWQVALDGWNARVKANPAVAQQFSAHYHGS